MAPAIPYRTDAPVSGGTFATALLITSALIAMLLLVLILIRRRGWIAMPGIARTTAPMSEGIQVQASRRLSMATTAYVMSYRGNTYMVVESGRGFTTTTRVIETEISPEDAP